MAGAKSFALAGPPFSRPGGIPAVFRQFQPFLPASPLARASLCVGTHSICEASMQPTVQAVFVVVASVIGSLLTLGMGGILTMLSLDRDISVPQAAPAGVASDERPSETLPIAA